MLEIQSIRALTPMTESNQLRLADLERDWGVTPSAITDFCGSEVSTQTQLLAHAHTPCFARERAGVRNFSWRE